MASRSIDSVDPPGDATNAYHRLPSVLLDQHQVEVTDCRNETTAEAKSLAGYTMAVSFWMAKPPDVSFFSVHCTKPPGSTSKTADFTALPHVVGVEGRFVLIRSRFYSRYGDYEYFMYKAGDGEPPSLDWVPPPSDTSLYNVREFGIMPRGHQGHYILAALCDAPSDYQLRIYSSEEKSWCTRTLLNPFPGIPKIVPEKVISLGEGLLGWVDFSQGLLLCNFCQDPPGVRFIPLPEPLPGNRENIKASCIKNIKASFSGASARWFWDLTCVSGVLKFVEMEHRDIVPEIDPSNKEFLYNSDLIMSLKHKYDMLKEPHKTGGWRAVTWTQAVSSNCWSKGCAIDSADFTVDGSTDSFLMSGARGETVSNFSLRDVYSAFPTLSQDGDDILYLKSFIEPGDQNGWVVAADPENKTVTALGVFSFYHSEPSMQALRPCTFSHHLNMTPGIEVSVCRKMTLMDSSAIDPNNISIRMDEPISCEPRTSQRPLAEVNLAQSETQCVARNGSRTRFRVVDPVKSMKKLRKMIVAEKIRAKHEAQNICT